MGKRSRKGRSAPVATPPAPARPRPRPHASGPPDERPKPPWHPVPLVELCVLVGIVLIVLGFLRGRDGAELLIAGLMLASLAGLDTVARDHFAGYRSHSTLLAGVPAVLIAGVFYFARAPWIVLVVLAVAAFAAALVYFRREFRRRSGGLSFR